MPVRILALLMVLAQAPPDPGEAGEPERPRGAIAVHWRMGDPEDPPDVPDDSLRASLREQLAALDGRPSASVSDRALARARVAVSRERPAAILVAYGELRARLEGADAAFREGRFDEAEQEATSVLTGLAEHPELPGAAAMAREARLLVAAIAWAEGDREGAEAALRAALVLDPEALLSTRRAPPELVARYRALASELLDARETTWIETDRIEPALAAEPGVEIEIDGVPAPDRVPPGEHFVVVYREGHEPVASFGSLDRASALELGRERIAMADPDVQARAEALCGALELELLVLAERRGAQVGLQAHRCGAGFGPRWIGEREQLAAGVAAIVAGPFEGERSTLPGAWPTRLVIEAPIETSPIEPRPRPWYRKGWIWGTSAGVVGIVGGAIATGVVLGTRRSGAGLVVDANDFIGF